MVWIVMGGFLLLGLSTYLIILGILRVYNDLDNAETCDELGHIWEYGLLANSSRRTCTRCGLQQRGIHNPKVPLHPSDDPMYIWGVD